MPSGSSITTQYSVPSSHARYFDAQPVDFSGYEVDFSGYTPFEVSVLRATRRIPYGETRSYREVAEAIGKLRAYRAVAFTLSWNRSCVVVPCHRVVESSGHLGGFAAGLAWKEGLLWMEGARKA